MRMAAIVGISLFTVLIANSSIAASPVRIWRDNGSQQCRPGTGRSLALDQRELEAAGVRVLAASTRAVPKIVATRCGAPAGKANTFRIWSSDWSKIKRKFRGPAAFALWPWAEQ
jgi:hypothetical protein